MNVSFWPGLATSDRQVRVLLRDIAGKACWDASALYYDPSVAADEPPASLPLPERYVLDCTGLQFSLSKSGLKKFFR